MDTIKISCDGTRYIDIDDIVSFQGNLKRVTRKDIDNIKFLLKKNGVCSPLFLWRGKPTTLDGHQRTVALRELKTEGYLIPPLPAVNIDAESEADAAEKVVVFNSKYSKITEDGLFEFLSDHDLNVSGLSSNIQIQEIDIDKFFKEFGDNNILKTPEIELGDMRKNFNAGKGDDAEHENRLKTVKGRAYPVTLILNEEEFRKWNDKKQEINLKDDKSAFIKIMNILGGNNA